METVNRTSVSLPILVENITEWCFKFKYEFSKKLEGFLLSGILTDYIGIKMIHSNKLAVLSTHPSVELNIINSELFQHDQSYSLDFFQSKQFSLWEDAFSVNKFYELKAKKLDCFGLTAGISLSEKSDSHKVVVSFGTYSEKNEIEKIYLSNFDFLYKISRLVEKISHPMFEEIFSINLKSFCFEKDCNKEKSKIYLAINNVSQND